ncbi:unnamed protein product [Polarella glacialis]|uniref:Cupin domain-containing protein n=1 Tax=Polarella glacialis TaxID=89957 RepID=A0A813ILA8_POLGL|nr:unnamed protein product [Polarella glacialis]
MDAWWAAYCEGLRSRICDGDFIQGKDDAKMADSLIAFISAGLSGCRWETMDSKVANEAITKQEYIDVYALKLGKRMDVPTDGLYELKVRADKALQDAIGTAAPPLQKLLQAFVSKNEALKWSQGSFGPVVYTSEFLGTYCNAMISEVLYQHPEKRYGQSYVSGPRPLECGIFYIDPNVEYPLHYHQELEVYYLLGGETRFVWLVDGKLVTMDRKQGEWHFNPPNIPHAITTPLGKPHLSLWFREGGPGQATNNKFGPKWVGCADGLHMIDEHDIANIPDHVVHDDATMKGSLGFGKGTVYLKDCDRFLRALTPAQFEYLKSDPHNMGQIDSLLTPDKVDDLNIELNIIENSLLTR